MKNILRNSFWLVTAQIITRSIGFFYTIYLAKTLGVSDFGLLSVSLAYFSLISSVSDFGFNRFLVREISRNSFETSGLLLNVTLLRLSFGAILFAVFSLGLYFLDPDKIRVNLALLAIMAVFPASVSQTFDGVFVAIQKLKYSAISMLILSVGIALSGVFLINLGFGVTGAVVAVILGNIFYLLMLFSFIKSQNIEFLSTVSKDILKRVIKGSLPYGILGILGLVYFRVDTVLLGYIKGNYDTGIYAAAYKFLEAIIFVPSSLATALFPVAARLHEEDVPSIGKLYFKSIKLLFFLSLLILAGYIVIVPVLIKLFLPNYLSSISAIKVLSLALPFIFIHIPGAQILLATDKYLKQILFLSVFTLLFNLVLNLIFIPIYGYIAAAWITVASEAVSFVVFFTLLKIKVLK